MIIDNLEAIGWLLKIVNNPYNFTEEKIETVKVLINNYYKMYEDYEVCSYLQTELYKNVAKFATINTL